MQKKAILTFDCEPVSHVALKKIRSVLKKNDIKATFFVVGRTLQGQSDIAAIVNEMIADGHQIGNGGLTGAASSGTGASDVIRQIRETQSLIKQHCDIEPKHVRLVGLEPNKIVRLAAEKSGLSLKLWKFDSRDSQPGGLSIGWFTREIPRQVHAYETVFSGISEYVFLFHPTMITARRLNLCIDVLRRLDFVFGLFED